MKFTQIPADAFEKLQLNAGILVKSFTPATEAYESILGATSGGVTFTAVPEFKDFGEDLDGAPKNVKELKKLTKWEAKMSGTFKTVDSSLVKSLIGVADISSTDSTKIVPRADLKDSDFEDIWWVGDYSDKNTGSSAGYIAIHMMDVLNTSGFSLKTTDESKGEFAFRYLAHYSLDDQTIVPFEIYVKAGTTSAGA